MDKPTDVMFGGVSVVLVGDLLQVSGNYYLRNKNLINACLKFSLDHQKESTFLKYQMIHITEDFITVCFLYGKDLKNMS